MPVIMFGQVSDRRREVVPLWSTKKDLRSVPMPIESKNPVIENCRLHHITIQSRDLEASLRLYRDVLGMEIVAEFGSPQRRIFLLDVGDGSHVELVAPTADSPSPGSPVANDPLIHLALATTDVSAAIERVRQAGFEITVEPKDVELSGLGATIAFFKGPSGEDVEFFHAH
jgi:catechol 2,3-dioxygenase-like lactoylglutathione lyase family enzyme